MRSLGPPLAPGAKRTKPIMLSTATRTGVTEVLRAAMAAIEARRTSASAAKAKPAEWAPSL
jgi:hypothetical protein